MTEILHELAGFGRALRAAALPVGTTHISSFCIAAAELPAEDLYWAGRVTMVSSPDDIPVYDEIFARYFGEATGPDERGAETSAIDVIRPGGAGDDTPDPAGDPQPSASTLERLRERSFSQLTDEELAQLTGMMDRIARITPQRRTRRHRSRPAGASADLRRTVALSRSTLGEPMRVARRQRRTKPRRLVLLLDISGSMAGYSRALLLFAAAVARSRVPAAAYVFGTQLTDVTSTLADTPPETLLASVGDDVPDWSGGTRIGDAVQAFVALGRARLARGAVVVICSDGLDVGPPEVLVEAMAALHRLAHRVIWLNPLKEDPRYEPLARGMKAALPHVDRFMSGHSVATLEAVMRSIDG